MCCSDRLNSPAKPDVQAPGGGDSLLAETPLVFAFRAQGERLAATQGRAAPIPLGARRQDPVAARTSGATGSASASALSTPTTSAALILMDYPNRWCLKLYAHAELRDLAELRCSGVERFFSSDDR
jgi:hypothetical protein